MSEANTFHLSVKAAEVYEKHRVPAIFAPMAEATLDAVALPPCRTVLDIACGTGVMARSFAARTAAPCRIIGCDLNGAMIEVARANAPNDHHSYEWHTASATEMPVDDDSIDLAFCQHGLQFFPDKQAALKELKRALKPGGQAVVTAWRAVPPFFEVVAESLHRHLNEAAAVKAVKPFSWTNVPEILGLFSDAGLICNDPVALPVARTLPADFRTMRDELLSTPNEDALREAGDAVIETIVAEVLGGVAQYRSNDVLVMPQEANLFVATAE